MARSTSQDPLDIPDKEDLETGPPELPKEQRILLALSIYYTNFGTQKAEPIYQIANRFQISRSILQDRIEGARSKKEIAQQQQLLSPGEKVSIEK